MNMRKGNRIKKYIEVFYRLEIKESFRKQVHLLRKETMIPINGFVNLDDYWEWQNSMNSKFNTEKTISLNPNRRVSEFAFDTIKKENLPYDFLTIMTSYIFFGTAHIEDNLGGFGCNILNGFISENLNLWDLSNDGVILFIYPFATKRDILQFIESRWGDISWWLTMKGKTPRIRKSIYKVRDELIYEKYKKGFIKSDGTADIRKVGSLSDLGIGVSNPDHIRKIIAQQRKLRER